MFFVVLGNYAAFLELNQTVEVLRLIETMGPPDAIVAVLQTLPLSGLVLFLFTVVCIIFAATSYDSASYTLATVATRRLAEAEDPGRLHRVFWAILLGFLPITLIYMGGLRPLQSAVTLASVPLLLILALATYGLWRDLDARVRSAQAETSSGGGGEEPLA